MKNPPSFSLWVVLARDKECEPPMFQPWFYGGSLAVFNSRREADRVCKEIRKQVGRGNVYVQLYGPMS